MLCKRMRVRGTPRDTYDGIAMTHEHTGTVGSCVTRISWRSRLTMGFPGKTQTGRMTMVVCTQDEGTHTRDSQKGKVCHVLGDMEGRREVKDRRTLVVMLRRETEHHRKLGAGTWLGLLHRRISPSSVGRSDRRPTKSLQP